MKSVVDELLSINERCTAIAAAFDEEPLATQVAALRKVCTDLYDSWSGSWIGYQASVYLDGFQPRIATMFFDRINGLERNPFNKTIGPWREYTYDEVVDVIKQRSGVADLDPVGEVAFRSGKIFADCKDELIPTLAAVAHARGDPALLEFNEELRSLKPYVHASDYVQVRRGNITQPVSDMRAIGSGPAVPPHIQIEAWLLECISHQGSLSALGRIARQTARYLERVQMTKQASRPESKTVFIGHGASPAWKELRDLLRDRLALEHEEFDRESVAGLSVKDRLSQMLDACSFAFLVLTAEDEHADGTHHARENVIHELGLTQGRYGFKRAIVLLEDGCKAMSNIHGLVHIRFPAGNLSSVSEQIRRVLEREGLIVPTA